MKTKRNTQTVAANVIGAHLLGANFDRHVHENGNIELVSEASDIGRAPFGQLYNDACDVGFVLVSRTGAEAAFYLTKEERDGEGELVAWHFKADADAVRAEPILAKYEVVIFND